ncbi:hypothetical protein BDV98DRAFT_540050 [Pterulicium gracile]|uniref:Defect at low temperature protein 1 n=1 Tax=Pterulicium gracile TaxID=1884261 RepID=A0A5C3QXK9_9AGAR|nr:hypothetical protein BDV98DRAFT_540050 [Pterula gracilis]
MLSFRRLQRTFTDSLYFLFILVLLCAFGLSCTALISQAIRSSPRRTWRNNFNAVIVWASYLAVVLVGLIIFAKRKFATYQRMSRISKMYRTLGRNDLPKKVHAYVTEEYARACLTAHSSLPSDIYHEGWGRPGSRYAGIRFRRALLDTIPKIGTSPTLSPPLSSQHSADVLAHLIIPSHPTLKPHAHMIHHFRFLLPFLQDDEDGIPILHYYDSAVQLARNSTREPTEKEFELGMDAAEEIMRSLHEVLLGLQEDSTTQLSAPLTMFDDAPLTIFDDLDSLSKA